MSSRAWPREMDLDSLDILHVVGRPAQVAAVCEHVAVGVLGDLLLARDVDAELGEPCIDRRLARLHLVVDAEALSSHPPAPPP